MKALLSEHTSFVALDLKPKGDKKMENLNRLITQMLTQYYFTLTLFSVTKLICL